MSPNIQVAVVFNEGAAFLVEAENLGYAVEIALVLFMKRQHAKHEEYVKEHPDYGNTDDTLLLSDFVSISSIKTAQVIN